MGRRLAQNIRTLGPWCGWFFWLALALCPWCGFTMFHQHQSEPLDNHRNILEDSTLVTFWYILWLCWPAARWLRGHQYPWPSCQSCWSVPTRAASAQPEILGNSLGLPCFGAVLCHWWATREVNSGHQTRLSAAPLPADFAPKAAIGGKPVWTTSIISVVIDLHRLTSKIRTASTCSWRFCTLAAIPIYIYIIYILYVYSIYIYIHVPSWA